MANAGHPLETAKGFVETANAGPLVQTVKTSLVQTNFSAPLPSVNSIDVSFIQVAPTSTYLYPMPDAIVNK
jgi:hypothetical protein